MAQTYLLNNSQVKNLQKALIKFKEVETRHVFIRTYYLALTYYYYLDKKGFDNVLVHLKKGRTPSSLSISYGQKFDYYFSLDYPNIEVVSKDSNTYLVRNIPNALIKKSYKKTDEWITEKQPLVFNLNRTLKDYSYLGWRTEIEDLFEDIPNFTEFDLKLLSDKGVVLEEDFSFELIKKVLEKELVNVDT